MIALSAVLGLVIGCVIGGLGGGGGALTVPALVYLLGLTAQAATTSSVLIVGISSLAGVVTRLRDLRWSTGLALAAVGMPVAHLGGVLNARVGQPVVLGTFAVVTVLAAAAMLLESRAECPDPAPASGPGSVVVAPPAVARVLVRLGTVVVGGAAVGFLTGFLGVGGGFLMLPVLVVALRMPLPAAIGTSLLIMVLNSAAALASRSGSLALDWAVIVPFTAASVVGTLVGRGVADRLSSAALTRAFALVLLLVGVVVGVESLLST